MGRRGYAARPIHCPDHHNITITIYMWWWWWWQRGQHHNHKTLFFYHISTVFSKYWTGQHNMNDLDYCLKFCLNHIWFHPNEEYQTFVCVNLHVMAFSICNSLLCLISIVHRSIFIWQLLNVITFGYLKEFKSQISFLDDRCQT